MSKQFATFAADKIRISTRLPSGSVWTVMCWAKVNSAAASGKPFFYRCNNTAHPYVFVGASSANALTLDYSLATSGGEYRPTAGPTLVVGAWNHIALTVNDPAIAFYLNGVVNASGSRTASFEAPTNDMLFFGNEDDTDAGSGLCSIAAIKIWDGVALTPAEIARERFETYAVRRSNLYCEIPLRHAFDRLDRGPSRHNADVYTGSLTDSDPPLLNPRRPRRLKPWLFVTGAASSSVGASAGTCTVTGVGASLAQGAGASAGTSTCTGVGASLVAAVGASAGTSTAIAYTASFGTSAGTATVSAVIRRPSASRRAHARSQQWAHPWRRRLAQRLELRASSALAHRLWHRLARRLERVRSRRLANHWLRLMEAFREHRLLQRSARHSRRLSGPHQELARFRVGVQRTRQ